MLSKREKVLIAVLGSILLHCLILFLFGVGLRFQHEPPASKPDEPITMTITPEETPADQPPVSPLMPEAPKPMVDNQNTNAPAPENAPFESNENSVAASEEAATGSAPVPTQTGKKIPEFNFDTHDYSLGDKPAVNGAEAQPAPDQQQLPPQPTPPPQVPTEPPRPKVDRTRPLVPAQPTPPPATPEPPVARDEFAMLSATPTPHPPPEPEDNRFDPTHRDPFAPPKPTPAVRSPVQPPVRGYQPMTQKAAMSGGISNKGMVGVEALGTPMGRYRKAITDAIGSRWYYYMGQRSDIASFGSVKIHFIVDRSGATMRPTVVSNSGNSTLENVSVQAITEATIPPMPQEVADVIQSNQLEIDFSFSLVDY